MKSKLLAPFALLALAAVVLSACGGGAAAPAASTGDPAAGKTKFEGTCSACHGMDAKGLPGLGKDLTTSTFAIGLSDDDLVKFLTVGRDTGDPLNTTGVQMPPRGGNPALTEKDLHDIVAYVRTLEK